MGTYLKNRKSGPLAFVKITNEELFYSKVDRVDLDGLLFSTNRHYGISGNFICGGLISIDFTDGWTKNCEGTFGSRDFEEEFGFILYCDSE